MSWVIANGVCKGEFWIMLNNKEQADVSVVILRCNRHMVNTDNACMMPDGINEGRMWDRS